MSAGHHLEPGAAVVGNQVGVQLRRAQLASVQRRVTSGGRSSLVQASRPAPSSRICPQADRNREKSGLGRTTWPARRPPPIRMVDAAVPPTPGDRKLIANVRDGRHTDSAATERRVSRSTTQILQRMWAHNDLCCRRAPKPQQTTNKVGHCSSVHGVRSTAEPIGNEVIEMGNELMGVKYLILGYERSVRAASPLAICF